MLVTEYNIPHGQSEQLRKVLINRLEADSINDVWLYTTPGHVILIQDRGQQLYIFTSVLFTGHQRFYNTEKWGAHLEFTGNPIRSVLFTADDTPTFLTVHKSGQVYQWKFDPTLGTWHQVSSMALECGEEEVETAILHRGKSVLYWTQRTAAETAAAPKYTIYTAVINSDEDEELALESRHPILTDCPPCALYLASDSLLVWFREPAPPGVYVTWHPVNRTLSMCIHGNSVVKKRQVYTHAISFHQMALQTSAHWAQLTPTTGWTLVQHGCHGITKFVAPDGGLWRVSNDGLLIHVCCLQRLHCDETGTVLGTLQSEDKVNGIWSSVSTAEAGFVTPKGFLLVSVKVENPGEHEVEEKDQWLKLAMSAPKAPGGDGIALLQSPALHLTALHQTRDYIDLDLRRQLIDHIKHEKPSRPTRLQSILEPLVCKFAELEDLQGSLFQNTCPTSSLSLEERICQLLPPSDDHGQHDVYQRLTLLSVRSPDCVAAAILARTGLVLQETVPCSVAASSYLRLAHGRPVLILATRLLFVTQPDHLVQFLDHILNCGSDDTAAFQKQTQAPVYSDILQNLPSHHRSYDRKMAVSALATIISRSGDEHCEEKSLTLLIENKLWREAVELLEQLSPKSDPFVPLYWRLVMAASQEGEFSSLSDSLLEMAPSNLSLVSLLHQMRTAVSAASNKRTESTEQNSDFPIGKLIQYLNTQMNNSQIS